MVLIKDQKLERKSCEHDSMDQHSIFCISLQVKPKNESGTKTNESQNEKLPNSSSKSNNWSEDQNISISRWKLLLLMVIPTISICSTLPVILLPQHNGILFPEYWYELIISTNLTFCIAWPLSMYFDTKMILKMSCYLSKCSYAKMYLAAALSFNIIYCLIYYVWTYGLKFHYPIPYTSLACYASAGFCFMTLWFELPKEARQNTTERKRIKSFFYMLAYCAFVRVKFIVLRKMFLQITSNLQWLMAFVLPIAREITYRILYYFSKRAAGDEDLEVKASMSILTNVCFSLFIAISIGSVATQISTYCILGIDFMLNVVSCFKIIRLHRKISALPSDSDILKDLHREEILLLALVEIVELLVPISYIATFVIAYYGPNAMILGGVKNNYWNVTAVENIWKFLKGTSVMVVFDVVFGLLSGLILWKFAHIDMLREFCKALEKFWPIITVRLASNAAQVPSLPRFNYNGIEFDFYPELFLIKDFETVIYSFLQYYNNLSINWGWDTTFQFDWIKNATQSSYCNQTEKP